MRDATQPYPNPPGDRKAPLAAARPLGQGRDVFSGDETAPCLACARERPIADYLFASLWPKALGGEAAPSPFQCGQICKSCREIADTRIDNGFLKSWFMQAELARAAQAFLDPQHPGPAPLTYLGTVRDFPGRDGEYCDRWAGLSGEVIYHVHRRADDAWTGFGGLDSSGPGVHAGEEATLVLSSPSLFWSQIALASFAAHFPFAERYCINQIAGLKGLDNGIAHSRHPNEIAWLLGKDNRATLLNAGLRHDFSHRFLIKLALGIGNSLLGPAFGLTAHARALRRSFWQQQPTLPAFGDAAPGFALAGAWTLSLVVRGNILGLIIMTPTGQRLDIAMADQPGLWDWPEHAGLLAGQAYVAIPPRRVFVGPLALPQCLAHQAGTGICDAIEQIESMRLQPRQLPSKQGFA